MKINVRASTMVKPLAPTPNTPVWFSNLDMITPQMYTYTLYFYRSTGAAHFFDPAELKAALSQTLVKFYPVAGRLRKDGEDRLEIDCNGEGAVFIEAEADGEIDELGDFAPKPELSLAPTVDYSKGISACPILLIQVTRFKCGGVCLGITIEHRVADGTASLHFINTWSDITRGVGVTTEPFLDRRLISARKPPHPSFPHVEYDLPPQLKTPQENSKTAPQPLIYFVFKLTRDQINALKANCQDKDEGSNKPNYSTYQVLAGHFWRCICKARGLPENQETKLYIPMDGRYRLQPPLPQGYFGNVVIAITTTALCGELESNPTRFAVEKIHKALARMDDEYLRSAIDYWEVQPDWDTRAQYQSPNFVVISWARLPFYDADFGWGKPVYVGRAEIPPEGTTFLLPSPTNDGSLLYAISLPKGQVQVFEKLLYDI